jgi:hypothetical protein
MDKPTRTHPYRLAVYIEFRELFDRIPELAELVSLIKSLDMAETAGVLCQVNADLRLVKPDREAAAKLQRELAGSLLDDDAIGRLQQRLPIEHPADRPIFHPLQILNVLQLVFQHSKGSDNPAADAAAKYRLGTACLMMSDLLMTQHERAIIASGTNDEITQSLMIQSLGPFEV